MAAMGQIPGMGGPAALDPRLAAITQRPSGMGAGASQIPNNPAGALDPQTITMLLSFLAGAGLKEVIGNVMKLMRPQGSGENRQHRGGARIEAAQNPGLTVAPQMLQRAQNPAQTQQLLQTLLASRGSAGT